MNNFIPKLIKYNKYYNKSGFLVPFARIEDKKKNNYEKYFAVREGINSRLDEIQASILNVKLKYLQYYINRRKEIAKIYDNNLKNYHLTLPKEINNNLHVYYEYVVSLNNRDQVISKLKKKNVYLKVTYRYPVHIMKPYKKFSLKKKN